LEGAGGIGGLLARTDHGSGETAYYHADGNGNVTALVNEEEEVIMAGYQYDPFGNILSLSGPLAEANLYRFSSKELHEASGLIYYLYRYYDPNLQKWPNRDTIGELGGVNVYAFVGNRPVDVVDLYGLVIFDEAGFPVLTTGTALDTYLRDDPTAFEPFYVVNDLFEGGCATVDGIIPFGNPLDSYYDPNDPLLQRSQRLGEFGRDLLLSAVHPNASLQFGNWGRNALRYELGSLPLPSSVFQQIKNLNALQKYDWLKSQGFTAGQLLRGLPGITAGDRLKALLTFPTPAGWTGALLYF